MSLTFYVKHFYHTWMYVCLTGTHLSHETLVWEKSHWFSQIKLHLAPFPSSKTGRESSLFVKLSFSIASAIIWEDLERSGNIWSSVQRVSHSYLSLSNSRVSSEGGQPQIMTSMSSDPVVVTEEAPRPRVSATTSLSGLNPRKFHEQNPAFQGTHHPAIKCNFFFSSGRRALLQQSSISVKRLLNIYLQERVTQTSRSQSS